MDEVEIKDQLATLVREIRAQTAKMEIVSTKFDKVIDKLDRVTVKPVTANLGRVAVKLGTALDAGSPTPTTSMASRVDIHGVVPSSSGCSSVTIDTTQWLVPELPARCLTPILIHDICLSPGAATALGTRDGSAASRGAPPAAARQLAVTLELDEGTPTRCLMLGLGAGAFNGKSTGEYAFGDKSTDLDNFNDKRALNVPVALEAALFTGLRPCIVPKFDAPEHYKVQWQPWPPPLRMYLQKNLLELIANSGVTSVPGTIDPEDQFINPCANLNVLKFFLEHTMCSMKCSDINVSGTSCVKLHTFVPTENRSIQYKVLALRPVPWPSFTNGTTGFQSRTPWPSFKVTGGSKFRTDAILNPFEWCCPHDSRITSGATKLEEFLGSVRTVLGIDLHVSATGSVLSWKQSGVGEDQRPSWPPSPLVLADVMSDLQHYKPCAELEEAIWSGLISRATRALKLWCIPWFRVLIFEMTREEWEMAWQLEGNGNGAHDNLTIEDKGVGIAWSLHNIHYCNTSALQSSNVTMNAEHVCYYHVPLGMAVLDMQQLRLFAISVFSCYNTPVAEPVLTELLSKGISFHPDPVCVDNLLQILVSSKMSVPYSESHENLLYAIITAKMYVTSLTENKLVLLLYKASMVDGYATLAVTPILQSVLFTRHISKIFWNVTLGSKLVASSEHGLYQLLQASGFQCGSNFGLYWSSNSRQLTSSNASSKVSGRVTCEPLSIVLPFGELLEHSLEVIITTSLSENDLVLWQSEAAWRHVYTMVDVTPMLQPELFTQLASKFLLDVMLGRDKLVYSHEHGLLLLLQSHLHHLLSWIQVDCASNIPKLMGSNLLDQIRAVSNEVPVNHVYYITSIAQIAVCCSYSVSEISPYSVVAQFRATWFLTQSRVAWDPGGRECLSWQCDIHGILVTRPSVWGLGFDDVWHTWDSGVVLCVHRLDGLRASRF